jgi:hypothetical protein
VLAVADAISQGRVFEAQEAARKSVKQGLVSSSSRREPSLTPLVGSPLHQLGQLESSDEVTTIPRLSRDQTTAKP